MHLVFPSLGDRIGAVNEFKAEWAEQVKKFGWDGPATYYGKVNSPELTRSAMQTGADVGGAIGRISAPYHTSGVGRSTGE